MIRAVLCAALTAGAAMATPITFTISAYGSGTLNGVSFPDTLITFTQVTDTSLITNGCFSQPIYCSPGSTSNTVTIGGSTYTVTDSTDFAVAPGSNALGILDITGMNDIQLAKCPGTNLGGPLFVDSLSVRADQRRNAGRLL